MDALSEDRRNLVLNPESAQVVKLIFQMYLEDAKRKNLLMGSNPIIAPDSEMLWNAAIVWRILRRYEYTGALVIFIV